MLSQIKGINKISDLNKNAEIAEIMGLESTAKVYNIKRRMMAHLKKYFGVSKK